MVQRGMLCNWAQRVSVSARIPIAAEDSCYFTLRLATVALVFMKPLPQPVQAVCVCTRTSVNAATSVQLLY